MKLTTTNFEPNTRIPTEFAFCDYGDPVVMAPNRNPALVWDTPDNTKSFVLIVHDSDVPSKGDDVNQADREVPADLPRVDFFHWVLVDIPVNRTSIDEGEFCDGVTARGKTGPDCIVGDQKMRHGTNDYTGWFAGDPDMEGNYFGYDGPCPPWNDSIVHHYHFTIYALDVERCPVEGTFTGQDVRDAIASHTLEQASFVATYSLNKRLQ